MSTELANIDVMEQVIIQGNLAQLQPQERVQYYRSVCESVGLNPLTKPFDYITLNGKLVLYAKKDATDQLRKINKISITKVEREFVDDLFMVTAYAQNAEGRVDTDLGVVTIGSLKGDKKANAIMKAITKAKRRVTLSIAGLGWLDETEIETIPSAAPALVTEEGEIIQDVERTNKQQTNGNRPYAPEVVRTKLEQAAYKFGDYKATQPQRSLLRYALELCFAGEDRMDDKRHTVLSFLTSDPSTSTVDSPFVKAILDKWLKPEKDEGDDYRINADAEKEAHAIYAQALKDEGQIEMEV